MTANTISPWYVGHVDDVPREVPNTDNRHADTLPPLQPGGLVCAVSSVPGARSARPVAAEVVRRIEVAVPVRIVGRSANVPGGDAHNHPLESRYAGLVRHTA